MSNWHVFNTKTTSSRIAKVIDHDVSYVRITCQFISSAVLVVIFGILSLNFKLNFYFTCKQKIF